MRKSCFINILIFYLIFCVNFKNNINAENYVNKKPEEGCNIFEHTTVILLHLYDMDLMDEFITRINKFVLLNKCQKFYIKINVPVSLNVESFNTFNWVINALKDINNSVEKKYNIYKYCIESAPYHPEKITYDNCLKLYLISRYLKESLVIESEKIQVIFSENRGVDIGGFFLLLDQLIKENLPHDYLVKLHTKKRKSWRNKLLAILNLNLKDYIPQYDSICPCKVLSSMGRSKGERFTRLILREILYYFEIPEKEKFYFSAGTMFIVSHKMTDFFRKYNRIELFNQLNLGYPKHDGQVEHAYERFFGYLIELLGLRVHYCNSL